MHVILDTFLADFFIKIILGHEWNSEIRVFENWGKFEVFNTYLPVLSANIENMFIYIASQCHI